MPVMHRGKPVTAKDLIELPHVGRHVLRIDRRILNHGYRLGVSGNVCQAAPTRLCADSKSDSVRAPNNRKVVAEAGSSQFALQAGGDSRDVLARFGSQLDGENGAWVSLHEKAVLALLEIGLRAFKDIVVHQLASARCVAQRHQIRAEGFVDAGAVHADERDSRGGSGSHAKVISVEESQRSLGARKQPAKIE